MSHNTLIHRVVRVGVRPLVATPITPNQLTTVRVVLGVAAASAFATGAAPWLYVGAGLFVLSMLFDRADGELARLSGKTSPWGHTYDLMSDTLCNALAFVGVGVGLRASHLGWWSIPMGILAGVAVAVVLWLVMRIESLEGQRAAELQGPAAFDPDDAMLAVPLSMLAGWQEPLLIAACIGAPSFAVFFYWRFRHKLAPADTSS